MLLPSPGSPKRRRFLRLCALSAWLVPALACHGEELSVHGAQGLAAAIDANSGRYEIRCESLSLRFAGRLGNGATELRAQQGSDRLGAYQELEFRWRESLALKGSIRTYAARPVVLFAVTAEQPADSEAQSPARAVVEFPRFTELPLKLHAFSYRDHEFAPPVFAFEETGTPWLFFDSTRAAILSPASNFMIAALRGDGRTQAASALNAGVAHLAAGFTHQTLLVFSAGVNAAWEAWGAALADLHGGRRPPNDADASLRYLGYWTDNGAAYYYDYDRNSTYAGTLEKLVEHLRHAQIPIRYLQLDSWWYYKTLTDPDGHPGAPKNPRLPGGEWNRYGGLLAYRAHPALFAGGLPAFQQGIRLPLILHNRWVDPESPYHARYEISGLAALDANWWREIMDYVGSSNGVTYEQDWLSVIYHRSPGLIATPDEGRAFMDAMARAARERGITLQYSMALPRHFLQGVEYENLTTARVSPDRFTRVRWDGFLYTSRLASALGIWPWADVFMSRETDNLLLATLSAGIVGIGDAMGREDRRNLLRAVRADGVIVKPDTPLLPIDAMYVADAAHTGTPMIAAAHTAHGALRTAYVFGYRRRWTEWSVAFTPAEVGVAREAYVYDPRGRSAHRLGATDTFRGHLGVGGSVYFVVAPVSRSGITLFGDADMFVPDGHKRLASLEDDPDGLTAVVRFAPAERSVRLFGYAPRAPAATSRTGSTGTLEYDERTGRFELVVYPGAELLTEGPGNDAVREAIVTLRDRRARQAAATPAAS